jgi:hypothetical protein
MNVFDQSENLFTFYNVHFSSRFQNDKNLVKYFGRLHSTFQMRSIYSTQFSSMGTVGLRTVQ